MDCVSLGDTGQAVGRLVSFHTKISISLMFALVGRELSIKYYGLHVS